MCFIIPPHNEVVGGYIGFTPSVRPSVCSSRILYPLCSAYSSGWIHFIFIHLIKLLQKVCHVQSFLQNLNFWQFKKKKICNFDFVFFWLGFCCESLVWVIIGQRGVSQNTSILVFPSFISGKNWEFIVLYTLFKTSKFVIDHRGMQS